MEGENNQKSSKILKNFLISRINQQIHRSFSGVNEFDRQTLSGSGKKCS